MQLEPYREAWENLINHRLIEWGSHPEQLEDDDLTAPSPDRIVQAIQFATRLRNTRMPAPTRIVPDGEGGIVFEYRRQRDSEAYRIGASGVIEYVAFKDGSIITRQQLK